MTILNALTKSRDKQNNFIYMVSLKMIYSVHDREKKVEQWRWVQMKAIVETMHSSRLNSTCKILKNHLRCLLWWSQQNIWKHVVVYMGCGRVCDEKAPKVTTLWLLLECFPSAPFVCIISIFLPWAVFPCASMVKRFPFECALIPFTKEIVLIIVSLLIKR